jgi:hypothetical protein
MVILLKWVGQSDPIFSGTDRLDFFRKIFGVGGRDVEPEGELPGSNASGAAVGNHYQL